MGKLTGAGSGGGGSDSSSERTRFRDLTAALGLPAPGRAAVSCGLIGCTWRFPLGGFPSAPSMLPLPHKHPGRHNASTLNDMSTSQFSSECMLSLTLSATSAYFEEQGAGPLDAGEGSSSTGSTAGSCLG